VLAEIGLPNRIELQLSDLCGPVTGTLPRTTKKSRKPDMLKDCWSRAGGEKITQNASHRKLGLKSSHPSFTSLRPRSRPCQSTVSACQIAPASRRLVKLLLLFGLRLCAGFVTVYLSFSKSSSICSAKDASGTESPVASVGVSQTCRVLTTPLTRSIAKRLVRG